MDSYCMLTNMRIQKEDPKIVVIMYSIESLYTRYTRIWNSTIVTWFNVSMESSGTWMLFSFMQKNLLIHLLTCSIRLTRLKDLKYHAIWHVSLGLCDLQKCKSELGKHANLSPSLAVYLRRCVCGLKLSSTLKMYHEKLDLRKKLV